MLRETLHLRKQDRVTQIIVREGNYFPPDLVKFELKLKEELTMIIEDLEDLRSFVNLVDKSRKEFIWKDLVKEFRISFTEPLSELSGAFRDTEFNTIDLRGFDTSWVEVMSDLFLNCRSLEKIDLRGLDTSNVSYMAGMFRECHQLKKLDLSDLYFPDVLDLAYMFDGCYSLEELNLPNLNTKNVIYLSKMFRDCKELKEIDLSSFDTLNVQDMNDMFQNCDAKIFISEKSSSLEKFGDKNQIVMKGKKVEEEKKDLFSSSSLF